MSLASASSEKVVQFQGGKIALSTRGPAFRVRFLFDGKAHSPIDTPMVAPEASDLPFQAMEEKAGNGIYSSAGSVLVSPDGKLVVRDLAGNVITESEPLANSHEKLVLSSNNGKLYGRGAAPPDARKLTADKGQVVDPMVCNRATYTPYYYSTDGYGALGVAKEPEMQHLPAKYTTDGSKVTWTFTGPFELYLMPAATLEEGTTAYYTLIGAPVVLPRYAFGFGASRWGWTDRAYIEDTIHKFRAWNFPIDYIIIDFEWFTNESDYSYQPAGKGYYRDFGFNPVTFPEPQKQLATYKNDQHIKMAGIRKPRLGNTELLDMARSKGWILPNGEPGGGYPPDLPGSYAKERNLDYSQKEVRDWYSKSIDHFTDDGVSFWWNDEGETNYYTFHWWNVAQVDALRTKRPHERFFSLNRAWSPGMARMGAAVWTGDVDSTWDDLMSTPGMMLNWVLGGAPYVGCDIGGFLGNTSGPHLTRWMQVGTFMPIMRVHSVLEAIPHFPWNFGQPAARAMQKTLNLRYRLIPYHYSLAHALYATFSQWIKPLVMEFPDDAEAADISTQWMDGSILVAPVLRQDSMRDFYLPKGTWYKLAAAEDTKASVVLEGPGRWGGSAADDEIPAFVRPGTVLPLAPVVQYSEALPGGPLEVQVYAGADGSFDLVEDDGESTAYLVGQIRTTRLRWDDATQTLSWKVDGAVDAAGEHVFKNVYMTLIDRTGIYHSDTKLLGTEGSIHFGAQQTFI